MSSMKHKRKHPILDDDDNDSDNEMYIPASTKRDSRNKKKKPETNGNDDDKRKRRMKRIVIASSSDEDDNVNLKSKHKQEIVSDSINDIKKNAKIRAKKLARGEDDNEMPQKTSSKSPKVASPPTQKNNILNYFKPKYPEAKEKQQPQSDKSKNDNKSKYETKKEEDDDGYVYTTINSAKSNDKIQQKSAKTKEKIDDKKSKSIIDDTIREKPMSKAKSSIDGEKSSSKLTNKSETSTVKKLKSPKKSNHVQVECLPRIIEEKRVSELWVDKYRPKNVGQIIGQQGDRSSLNKLIKWLKNWHSNMDKKPGFGKWGPDDGAGFRAALLSGPPGIGKTTTAQLVCRELGYDYLELNASDQRNKRSINDNVRDLLQNTKLTNFFRSSTKSVNEKKLSAQHCLIMDEVDGVSGNEDRGGIAELIQLIKTTKIPIICICNDRGDQKMRSLVNYCFDLRFHRPRLEQIRGMLMSIAHKEKMKINNAEILDESIVSSNYDIRQCINNLYLLSIQTATIPKSIDNKTPFDNKRPIKDVRLTPFEAVKKVFATGQDYAMMSLDDKSNLFFCDYSIMPLFVYENYISINLSSKQPSIGKQLKRLYKSIDSISRSDLIEKEIRSNQSWSLLPMQAMFSTVMPGAYMRSENGLGFPQFPQFMGKLSTTNKNKRITDELTSHIKLSINASKQSIIMEYFEFFRNIIINSLKNLDKDTAITNVIELMEQYSLTKEDMDSMMEFCLWSGDNDPMKTIDSKIKAALTRAYNKKDFTLPYARDNDCRNISTKSKKGKKNKKNDWDSSQDESIDDDDDDFTVNDEVMADYY